MVRLGIFARPPVPGKVKTRLIESIGADNATAIYRYCLQHAIAVAMESTLPLQLYLTDHSDDPIFEGLATNLQADGDLGKRMLRALEDQLASTDAAIIIGSDCLDLNSRHLQEAAVALQSHDLVLLPAVDGGYVLIGCRRTAAELFQQVSWSTDQVLQQTIANANALGYSLCLLETVRDIDTLHDLEHYPELLELIA